MLYNTMHIGLGNSNNKREHDTVHDTQANDDVVVVITGMV